MVATSRGLVALAQVHHGNPGVGNGEGRVSNSEVLLQGVVDEGILRLHHREQSLRAYV